ncbi:hypothetical protein [Operophtera brumata reovirus]|uniref:hypothetical protein n=1 Tax=Operophtera brumata reovirus TaxID=352248 RepID=UPI00005D683A|nr:hypothetical protein [Operophtera brumata reovirus]ABB17209.1 unknown [Operophtera brumata reovirus]
MSSTNVILQPTWPIFQQFQSGDTIQISLVRNNRVVNSFVDQQPIHPSCIGESLTTTIIVNQVKYLDWLIAQSEAPLIPLLSAKHELQAANSNGFFSRYLAHAITSRSNPYEVTSEQILGMVNDSLIEVKAVTTQVARNTYDVTIGLQSLSKQLTDAIATIQQPATKPDVSGKVCACVATIPSQPLIVNDPVTHLGGIRTAVCNRSGYVTMFELTRDWALVKLGCGYEMSEYYFWIYFHRRADDTRVPKLGHSNYTAVSMFLSPMLASHFDNSVSGVATISTTLSPNALATSLKHAFLRLPTISLSRSHPVNAVLLKLGGIPMGGGRFQIEVINQLLTSVRSFLNSCKVTPWLVLSTYQLQEILDVGHMVGKFPTTLEEQRFYHGKEIEYFSEEVRTMIIRPCLESQRTRRLEMYQGITHVEDDRYRTPCGYESELSLITLHPCVAPLTTLGIDETFTLQNGIATISSGPIGKRSFCRYCFSELPNVTLAKLCALNCKARMSISNKSVKSTANLCRRFANGDEWTCVVDGRHLNLPDTPTPKRRINKITTREIVYTDEDRAMGIENAGPRPTREIGLRQHQQVVDDDVNQHPQLDFSRLSWADVVDDDDLGTFDDGSVYTS